MSEALRRLADISCLLGEGPTYDRYSDTAWWFDILNKQLFEYRFGDDSLKKHELPFAASALARIDEKRQCLFTEQGLYIRQCDDGSLSLLHAIEAENKHTRSNDARVHPSGAFWLGTMGWNAEKEAGSIYHYNRGELQTLFKGVTIPNAICFSPDGSVGYYADTALQQVMRVNLDVANGLPIDEPEIFITDFPENGAPDGAVTDAYGNIWIALWGASMVGGYDPQGHLFQTISVPAQQVSCPAFIGTDARRMLVTSAAVGLEEDVQTGTDGGVFLFDAPIQGKIEPDLVVL
ncbi:SMP-30/gluconolactonase/LRE family protein [Paenochrobactrum glaciei]|uniref:SMP-30/gluconolactonase/LRE family protein n=1 Tax=Paenochrobactrum glaciei TaxID=486407 RepID=A0ABN1GMD8_9HYPH